METVESRQAKGRIIGALGFLVLAAAAVAGAGHDVAAIGLAIPTLTAVYCVAKNA